MAFVAPKHFKWQLSVFAPQFGGYAQQDSQELLAFLPDSRDNSEAIRGLNILIQFCSEDEASSQAINFGACRLIRRFVECSLADESKSEGAARGPDRR